MPGARPLRGWDFGHVCPVVLLGQLDVYGRLQILAEAVLRGAPLETLIDAGRMLVVEHFGEPREGFDAGDPQAENITDLGQIRAVLRDHDIFLHTTGKAGGGKEASHRSLRSRMLEQTVAGIEGPSPKLLIHPRCVHLIKALSGGYHKSPKNPGQYVDSHPDKDVCDALRFLNDNLAGAMSEYQRELKKMATVDQVW